MKRRFYFILVFILILTACNSTSNSPEFMEIAEGRYMYNSNEVIEVFFENEELYLNWRGAKKIKPLPLGESAFFVKEMNEKINFNTNPKDGLFYMNRVPKEKDSLSSFDFRKMEGDEKVPDEYLNNGQYEKAQDAFKSIFEKDSLDSYVEEAYLNRLGYHILRQEENVDKAIAVFETNRALYPKSSNVYDSLGDAYKKKGDTATAITNYTKSIERIPRISRKKGERSKVNPVSLYWFLNIPLISR